MGTLLLKLIEWIIEPEVIDLTLEEPETAFSPPANTTFTSTDDKIPSDVIVLVAESATYSMYVHLMFVSM